MKKLLFIIALTFGFLAEAANCPTSATYNITTMTLNYPGGIPSGATYNQLSLRIKTGGGSGNTYLVSVVSTTSTTLVVSLSGTAIDGTSVIDKVMFYNNGNLAGITQCTTDFTVPVKLINFTYNKSTNSFRWTTATEVNNKQFIIQMSSDMKTWHSIDSVTSLAIAGTSNYKINYVHRTYVSPNYYRLAQEDFDGTITYSEVLYVYTEEASKFPKIINNIIYVNRPAIILDTEGLVVFEGEGAFFLRTGVYFIFIDDKWFKVLVL